MTDYESPVSILSLEDAISTLNKIGFTREDAVRYIVTPDPAGRVEVARLVKERQGVDYANL